MFRRTGFESRIFAVRGEAGNRSSSATSRSHPGGRFVCPEAVGSGQNGFKQLKVGTKTVKSRWKDGLRKERVEFPLARFISSVFRRCVYGRFNGSSVVVVFKRRAFNEAINRSHHRVFRNYAFGHLRVFIVLSVYTACKREVNPCQHRNKKEKYEGCE